MRKIIRLIISVALPLGIGALGSYFTVQEIPGWYQTLKKPSWQPPADIFGPVWTFLYVLMGIAFYLVWNSRNDKDLKSRAMILFGVHLVFNLLWSFIFFSLHETGWALADICILWLLILLCIILFARLNKLAAWLLVPYISWVSFAMILNYTLWQLNTE